MTALSDLIGVVEVNTLETGPQDIPSIAVLADGGFVVAYRSNPSNDVNQLSSILLQRFDTDGNKVGGEVTVVTAKALSGGYSRTSVVAAPDGGYFVFWENYAGLAWTTNIRGQRYSASGAAVGASFVVPKVVASPDEHAQDVAVLQDGSFVVTWSVGNWGFSNRAYARHFSATGAPISSQFLVSAANDTSGNGFPAIAALDTGGYVIVQDLKFEIYGSANQLVTRGTVAAAGSSNFMDVARLKGGGFAVAYIASSDIKARIFSNTGVPVGPEIAVNTTTTGGQISPAITGTGDGGFLVSWTDDNTATVRAQLFSALGAMVGGEVAIAGAGQTSDVALATLPDGRIAMSYWSQGEVYVQLFGTTSSIIKGTAGDDPLDGTPAADLMLGLGGADTLRGGLGDDGLNGGAGDDRLIGGGGADLLVGGGGTDTADYGDSAAAVTVSLAAPQGTGQGGDAAGDVLVGIENLIGSALGDVLTGSKDDNILDGGAGGDTMIGGRGNDTYVVDSLLDKVVEAANQGTDTVESFVGGALAANVENLLLLGSGNLDGTGNALQNIITGNAGNNVLKGVGAGDTVSYANAAAGVTVNLAVTTQQNTVGAGLDTLSGFANLIGSSHDDSLTGSSAANVIDGGAGNDTMTGSGGSDVYIVDAGGDQVVEIAGGGTDTVLASVSYQLADQVERLTLTGTGAITGTGNALANTIIGNSGDNTIDGGAGDDRLIGGLGKDTLSYASGATGVRVSLAVTTAQGTIGAGVDTVSGFENLMGSTFADSLTGDGNANDVAGGLGNDTLTGGLGADTLTGGTGDDVFRFLKPADGGDLIVDFNATTEADRIGILRSGFGIAATVVVGGTGASDFGAHYLVNGLTATEAHGQFLFDGASGSLLWDGDGTGRKASVLVATFTGVTSLLAADFKLT